MTLELRDVCNVPNVCWQRVPNYCGQTSAWIKMALGMEVGLSPVHIVLDGDTAPLPKRGQSPQFSAHLYCVQTTRCINMPLGMEVALSPVDFVLDGDPAPTSKGVEPHQFSAHVYCGQTAAWINMPHGTDRPRPTRDCVRCGPSYPRETAHPPGDVIAFHILNDSNFMKGFLTF